ncbi:helix-turn-helix transcriptional regulator [Solwaraspora sp. WMMD937]|uniref:helix-turn-helix transcriptional regulator n=1 Tax=Solwaraspora sp. WMMD937 TaxID=3016090 RepID=UPI00249B39F8|nr:helix-turn-helix transcriptional regulator [Solwaraspora sp. WMMD937]WFE24754.1 helix-turn-helix transcriptional regulator [Solwaraspora sp. WMMD937]
MPVVGFPRVPGLAPVAVARIQRRMPSSAAIPADAHTHDFVALCYAERADATVRRDGHQDAALAHLTLLLVAAARLSTSVADQLRASDEPISLADVAAELALTAGHLTTVVRRRTGRTVQQWIAQRRMQQARTLLAETALTVAAISRRVGYPDISYFIKRFRSEHSVTPAQWRAAGSRR